jgi:hypothetical protein
LEQLLAQRSTGSKDAKDCLPMKFSIRDLLLVTVIVALALGWRADHCRQIAAVSAISESQREADEKLSRLLRALESRGEEVTFGDMMVESVAIAEDTNSTEFQTVKRCDGWQFPTLQHPAPNSDKN